MKTLKMNQDSLLLGEPIDPMEPESPIPPPHVGGPAGTPSVALPPWFEASPVKIPVVGLYVEGTELGDQLQGSNYADDIYGLGGHDTLYGNTGNDGLYGGDGHDYLSGGAGNDRLYGDMGDDWLDGGAGADMLFGGGGWDTASYASAGAGVILDVATGGGTNDAQGDTYYDIDSFVGSNFSDIMSGDAGDNHFDGGAGDDFLSGNFGYDKLVGGSGGDNLVGGHGNDVLIGGTGHDTLTGDGGNGFFGADQFWISPDSGVDVITDFQPGIDKIVITGFDSTPFGGDGLLAVGHNLNNDPDLDFRIDRLDVHDNLFYNYTTHQLFLIDPISVDGHVGLGNDPQLLATFTNGAYLTTSDFLLM